MLFEGVGWRVAFRAVRAQGTAQLSRGDPAEQGPDRLHGAVRGQRGAARPARGAAGIGLGEWLELPVLDGVASIGIALILAATAAWLAYECKGLLIGEGVLPEVRLGIERILAAQPGILRVNEHRSVHLGPDDVLLNLSLDFASDLSADQVEAAISDLERRIKSAHPEIRRVFIEAQSWRGHRAALAED